MQVKYSYSKYTQAAPNVQVDMSLGEGKQSLRPEVQRRLDELTDLLTINQFVIGGTQPAATDAPTKHKFDVGTIIRMPWAGPTPESSRGFRVWRIEGTCLGGLGQESVYGLVSLDRESPNGFGGQVVPDMYVPVLLLETHPGIEVIG